MLGMASVNRLSKSLKNRLMSILSCSKHWALTSKKERLSHRRDSLFLFLPFPVDGGAGIWIECPFSPAIVFIHSVMEMGREFSGSPFFPVTRAPYVAEKRSGFHDIAFLDALIKISQMGKVMIGVMVVANTDAPSAVIHSIPLFR